MKLKKKGKRIRNKSSIMFSDNKWKNRRGERKRNKERKKKKS
jgi:hypothetical protein